MITPAFPAIIEKGKIRMLSPDRFKTYISRLEGNVSVIVRKRARHRTENQNAWYWACVVGIPALQFGYTPQEMHDAYKLMFLKREEQGKPITIGSTASLSISDFSEYVERCRQFCAEQDIDIPDPQQVDLSIYETYPKNSSPPS